MTWLFFAVATYALYSVTNFIEKFLIDKKIKYPSTVTILGGAFSFVVGVIIFSLRGYHVLPVAQMLLLLTSGTLLTLYLIPYFKALTLDDTSRVVPLFQFFPIFVLIISYLFLHESLTGRELLGFVFITVGGFILGTERIEKKMFTLRKSFWWMMLSSFLYGLTGIIFKYVNGNDFWLTVSYQTIGIGIGAFLLFLYAPYRRQLFQEVRSFRGNIYAILTINQILALLAEFANFYAITLAPVALVSVVQGIQPLFLLLYGFILTLWFPHIIKEDIRKETIGVKLFSLVLLFIGIYFIYL